MSPENALFMVFVEIMHHSKMRPILSLNLNKVHYNILYCKLSSFSTISGKRQEEYFHGVADRQRHTPLTHD
jgi:hypothetical protein